MRPGAGAVADAVTAGYAYLARTQLASGEFRSWMAKDADLRVQRVLDPTVFVTSYIVHALAELDDARARPLVTRALDFLAADMDPGGVWRYWPRGDPRHGWIPPDVDDTACVAAALERDGRPVPPIRSMLLANRDRQGRFYTWIAPRWPRALDLRWMFIALPLAIPTFRHKPWHFWMNSEASRGDVDLVVNANVLAFLGDGPHAEPVVRWFQAVVESGDVESADRWYESWPIFHYAAVRAWRAGVASIADLFPMLDEDATRRAEQEDLAPLDAALLASALLGSQRSGPLSDRLIARLLDTQEDEGCWPARVFYWGGPTHYVGWGAPALTTALAVEALTRSRASER